jgi:peptidoglycan hydrolase-like protein with peptidoglycan-binding domain
MTKQPIVKSKPEPQTVSPKIPLIIVGVVILICFTAAIVAHVTSNESGEPDGTGDNDGNAETKASITNALRSANRFRCLSKKYPLSIGNCHPNVIILQRYLKKMGADLGNTGTQNNGIDGNYGPLTQAASLKYLKKDVFNQQDIITLRKNL